MEAYQVFHALGDPIRLEIVRRLVENQPATISDVSKGLGITRQGARKHLQVLANVQIIKFEPKGRDVIVTLDHQTLTNARKFITQLEQQWDTRLLALKQFVEEE